MSALRRLRNFWIPWIAMIVLGCFSDAVAQTSYKVIALGSEGNDVLGCAMSVNNQGWTEIMAGNLPPRQQDNIFGQLLNGGALIDADGFKLDLGTLGGRNSWMMWGEINDQGQAVGYSGTCTAALHVVSWENGTASPLQDLGTGGMAFGINNQGQIVGTVGSADGTTQYGAHWQKNGALTNLGLLSRDFGGLASGFNSKGQVVGSNYDSKFNWLHAFIWQDGVITDLNTLLPDSSNLYATMANKINESGQISGMATVLSGPHAGDIHAFLATPVYERVGTSVADVAPTRPKSNLPTNLNKQLLKRFLRTQLAQ